MSFRNILVPLLFFVLSIVFVNENNAQCFNNVGTINGVSDFQGFSSRRDIKDTVFLCWQDRISIDHNNDYSVISDPDPTTPGGIGYGWYKSKPTIYGDTKLAILVGDDEYRFANNLTNIAITVGDLNGDVTFRNNNLTANTSFNDVINNSNPTLVYYAPITVDSKIGNVGYFENNGLCVKVDVDAAFPVVYLNPMEISDIKYNIDGNPLKVSFIVTGGAPEFYKKNQGKNINYSGISILDSDDISKPKGTILTSSFSHGDRVTALLPDFGSFVVNLEDDVSCVSSNPLIVAAGKIPTIKLDTVNGNKGDIVCVTFNVRDYESIEFLLSRIEFDPTVIKYDHIESFPYSPSITVSKITDGLITIDYLTSGVTFVNSTDYFRICFELVGNIGDCSPVSLIKTQIVNSSGDDLYPYEEPGMICILPPSGLYVSSKHCGTKNKIPEGSLTFKVYNGVAPYTYTIKKGAVIVDSGTILSSNDETMVFDLVNGAYVIEVKDANGDIFSSNAFISTIEPLEFEYIEVDQPDCFGDNTGEIRIKVDQKGGITNPYKIKWSTNSFGNDTLNNLSNGTYGVTIEDRATGCKTEESITLNTSKYNFKLEVTEDASCEGNNDGKVLATISGGIMDPTGYTLKWETSNSSKSAKTFNQLLIEGISPGKFHVRVYGEESNKWCDEEIDIDMGYQYEMEVSHSVEDLKCYNDSSGSVNFNVNLKGYTGDTFDIEFPKFPFPKVNVVDNDDFKLFDLSSGEQVVRFVEQHTGCIIYDTVNLSEPTPLQYDPIDSLFSLCSPDKLATADISVHGGAEPYTLSGIGADVVVSSNKVHKYDNLEPGDYTIVVTDSDGCDILIDFSVYFARGALKIDTIEYDLLGCDINGTTDIKVKGSSNFGNITFKWTDLNNNVLGNTDTLNNKGAGTYIIELSDNACTVSDTIVIEEGTSFTFTKSRNNAECGPGESGGDLGSACIKIDGDDSGFNFSWDNGMTGKCITGVQAGDYEVTISDGSGCVSIDTVRVNGAPPIEIKILDLVGVSCNDGFHSDGRALIEASGGNTNGLYKFSFDNGFNKTGKIITVDNLGSGKSYFNVSYNTISGHSCVKSDSFEVGLPAKLKLNSLLNKINAPSCFGDCNGKAIVVAEGGNDAAYFYHWQETGEDGVFGNNLCAGTYHVKITDANSCIAIDSITINEPEELIVSLDSFNTKDVNCSGNNSGQISIKFQGGNTGGKYSFKWSPDVSSTKLANDLPIGVYSVTVTDDKGCSDFISHEIKGQAPLVFDIPNPDTIKCFGGQTCIHLENVSGGAGPDYSFSINTGPTYSIDSCANVFASEDAYLVTVFDSEGCKEEKEVYINQPDQIIVDLGDDIVIDLGDSKTIHLNTNTNILNVNWDIDTTIIKYDFLNSQHSEIKIEAYKDATLYATITNLDGCTASGQINVQVNTFRNVYIPNIFTPDGDGLNDEFNITLGKGIKRVNYMKIFNRWGELMYNEENLAPTTGDIGAWDGTYKGRRVNPGVYVYLIEIEFQDDRVILYRGSITVLR